MKPEGAPGLALTIGAGQLDMNVGELAQLQAIPADGAGQPYTGLFTLSWSSSSPAIAAVSSTGQLSAVSAGTAVISAQATRVDTGAIASASVTLTVRAPPTQDTTPPSTPSGLSATSASATAVDLAWSASSDDVGVTGYRVLRGGAQIATVTTTNYADVASGRPMTQETHQQQPLASIDELEFGLARERGRMLVMFPGSHPLLLERAIYYDDPFFTERMA